VAFGFLSPLNLLFALAIAVPVAIHLLQRRREATVEFPAVRLLLLAQRRSSRRLRLRRLLLLLLRCLAVLVFALLLARPVLQAPGAAFREGEPGFTAVILDTSLSMSALSADDRQRFEAARDLARALAARGGRGERFALIEAAPAAGAPVAGRWLDRDGFLGALAAAGARPAVADPGGAFAEAYRLLRAGGGAQRRIIVISDLARGGWEQLSLAALPVLDPAVPVRVLRLAGDGARNRAGVVSIAARGESRVAGEAREVAAEVVNAGPERTLPVELWLDGALAASRIETAPPGMKTRIAFTVRPAAGGARRVEVRVPHDRYPADDRRNLALDVAPPIGVLVVDGDPGTSLTQGETFFLQEALRHERLAATVPVRIGVAGPEAPVSPVPEGTAVVVLANVRAPSEEAGRRLAEHVSAGGGLLIFWGPACDAEAWRRALSGLLPAAVDGTASADPGRPWRVGEVDLEAPPLSVFAPPAGGTFATASFMLRAQVGRPDPAARVLARFEDGAPWLVEQRVGRGRVVFVGSTADLAGNDLPTRPAYVPLAQRLVLWLAGSLVEAADAERVAGDILALEGGPELAGARATMETPSGARVESEFRAEGSGSRALLPPAAETGFYRWAEPGREGLIAVNVPGAESDLTALAAEELAERLRPVRAELIDVKPGGVEGDPSRLGERSLARPLLAALLVLLLLEALVAGPRLPWRGFARGSGTAPEA
jgi:hypothetical protein